LVLTEFLELLDWRRRMAELFVALRARPVDGTTLNWFRAEKDRLFAEHPQSPLSEQQRTRFTGLAYWPYDPEARVVARFRPASTAVEVPSVVQGELGFSEVGSLEFELFGQTSTLSALWIHGYAGGLFVPFRDATCGAETYGGGRYCLDTIKSADLGSDFLSGEVVLDFNYAYHPSCAYDARWVCPLAPSSSWLNFPIRAGERLRAVS
jgi:uncharacterized protein